MRSSECLIAILAAVLGTPVLAMGQNADTDAQTVARANATIAERYMTAVSTELTSKVDSKTATVGLEVTARTRDAATLADGTALPKGTKLVGHVIQVVAQSKDQPVAMLAITFDRAQLKDGSSVALRSLIRTVAPPSNNSGAANGLAAPSPMGAGPMTAGPMAGGPMGGGPMGGGGGMGGGGMGGGPVASVGGPTDPTGGSGTTGTRGGGGLDDGVGGMGGSLPGQTTRTIGQRTGMTPNTGSAAGGTMPVTKAGETTSTAPRRTALPGVMLSNSGGAGVSGVLMSGQNISLVSGTQITLGVISNQPRPAP